MIKELTWTFVCLRENVYKQLLNRNWRMNGSVPTVGCNDGVRHVLRTDSHGQLRAYDAVDGYRLRSDVVCFRNSQKKEVLLVSARSTNVWTIPGGGYEPGESFEDTALREAKEEAGVLGTILDFVGTFDHSAKKTRTRVFTMTVTEELDEWQDMMESARRRKWFPKEKAIEEIQLGKPWKTLWLQKALETYDNEQ